MVTKSNFRVYSYIFDMISEVLIFAADTGVPIGSDFRISKKACHFHIPKWLARYLSHRDIQLNLKCDWPIPCARRRSRKLNSKTRIECIMRPSSNKYLVVLSAEVLLICVANTLLFYQSKYRDPAYLFISKGKFY